MMVHIEFKREDRQAFRFQKITGKLASFLVEHNEYIRLFVHFLRDSYDYHADKFQQQIQCYQEWVRRKRAKGISDEVYVSLLAELSAACRHDSDVNDLRGMLAEQIFQACFKKRGLGRDWKCSTGCSVWINGSLVSYVSESDGKSKMTIDLGAWCFNRQMGEFHEVKLSPYAFHAVDFGYLNMLYRSLESVDISEYKIGIFSLDDKHLLRERIQQLGYDLLAKMQVLSLADFLEDGQVG